MARGTIETYDINGTGVTVEFDTGGPPGATEIISINGEDYSVKRWFYFDEFHEQYARNFAKKVVTDDKYRQKSLKRTADWAQVSDLYDEAARRILQVFRDHELLSYSKHKDGEEQRYKAVKASRKQICKSLFEEIKVQIRDEEVTDALSAHIDDQVETAKQIATAFDPASAHSLDVGQPVVDTGDKLTVETDDTSTAIVVELPPDTADAHHVSDGQTVADYNEHYPPKASVATVAFESELPISEAWVDDPKQLQRLVSENSIRTYTYPTPRLIPVDVVDHID